MAAVADLIQQMVDSYPGLGPGKPSSWFVVTNDGTKHKLELNRVCHANMRYYQAGVWDQLYTAVPKTQPLDIEYLNYLIEGPFRSFKDRIHLKTTEDGKYYLHCSDLDTWPANVLFNFCIASRTPIEFPDVMHYWGKLRAAGVNIGLAALLAARFGYTPADHGLTDADPWSWRINTLWTQMGHNWFDHNGGWKSVLNCEPDLKAFRSNFKAAPGHSTPANAIWGLITPAEGKDIIGKTVKELSEHFGLTKAVKPEVEIPEYVILEQDDDDDDIFDFDDDDDDDDFVDFDDDFVDDLDDDLDF